jgi:hypothetical protein
VKVRISRLKEEEAERMVITILNIISQSSIPGFLAMPKRAHNRKPTTRYVRDKSTATRMTIAQPLEGGSITSGVHDKRTLIGGCKPPGMVEN